MRTLNTYSQIKQDLTVLKLLNQKKNGIFVDIGCAGPIRFSNTYLLEKTFGWSGLAIDIENQTDGMGEWSLLRPNSRHIIEDALKIDYIKLFEINNLPQTIDYLSLDLEPPELTLECLLKIPFAKYNFKVITFETDEYRPGGKLRVAKSRAYLSSFGYKLVGSLAQQDDIYIYEPTSLQ